MFVKSTLVTVVAAIGCLFTAPPAQATAVAMAPHQNIDTMANGVKFTVGQKGEVVDNVPALNGTPTSREVILTGTGYARIDGPAGGVVTTGYLIGCGVNLGDVNLSVGGTAGLSPSLSVGSTGTLVTATPSLNLSTMLTVDLKPGGIVQIPVDHRPVAPGRTVYLTYRDIPVVLNGCVGAAGVTSYTTLQVTAPGDDDGDAVYGDSMPLN